LRAARRASRLHYRVVRFTPVAGVTPTPETLPRRLGLWSAVGLVVGITIGSGIFRSPANVARLVPNPLAMLALWIIAGLVTLCGALTFAELAASLPKSGGYYVFLREGWGRLPAFLFGWAQLVLIRASALGGIAIVFGEYLLRSLRLDPIRHTLAARTISAIAIGFAATVNILGVDLGAAIVNASTAAKFSGLAVLVIAALTLGGHHGASVGNLTSPSGGPLGLAAIGLAFVSILWAYDGFADVAHAGGEVKDPQRNLPRAIVLGTLAIVAIYTLTNVAYLYISPIAVIGRSPLVAAETMSSLFGQPGVILVAILVMVSSFSSLNGVMLASPRIFFAMADDGLFFRAIARVHPRYRTPYVAILLTAVLGIALVLSRSFEALTSSFVIAIWPFYALSVAAVYRLRRRQDLQRPYLVAGYPVVPALFIVAVVLFVANSLINDTLNAVVTFALIAAGIPVYYAVFRSAHNRKT
jgi:APA family basic amino acid/polyamine antiporter